ncbi:regulatory TetR family protein [Mumia flava]|uniref:Regulatory TetR family protein n=1 Tax=Mumia flava TaxID=1348852 RepID=A0A0B2BGA5_9ACTN|nr:TetR/AcrR family transcriptional regulator [Mumia flava]PJJ56415.1 regulatory TetR family protein [Mumia flava]
MPRPLHTPRRSPRQVALLEGLVDLFLTQGFLRFGIGDLAERLRCSRSTLYEIAPSKEQLVITVVRAFFRRSTERVEARVEAERDPVRRIGAYLDAIATELSPATPAFYADLDAFAPAREVYAQNTAAAARRVKLLVESAADPARAVDASFVGAVAAEVMESIQRGQMEAMTSLDDAQAYRRLADLIVAGVTGAPLRAV